MEQIEIIAYTVMNSTTHCSPKHFKHCFINSLDELIPFKEKVKKRWERKIGGECEIYPVLRHMDEIYTFPEKEKKERKHELYTRRTDNSKN